METDLDDLKALRGKRKYEDPKMDITPMIDVTFLLLIFFVVSSKLDPQMAVDLAKAKHGDAVPEKESVVLLVVADNPENPSIHLGTSREDPTASGNEEEQEQQIRDYVEAELSGTRPKRIVLVKAERGVKYRHMDRVYKAVKTAVTDQEVRTAVMEKK